MQSGRAIRRRNRSYPQPNESEQKQSSRPPSRSCEYPRSPRENLGNLCVFERLLEVGPEGPSVLDTDAEAEQAGRNPVAFPAETALDRRVDPAETGRVGDEPRRRLDASGGVGVG